jgi:branched-chain amino acid transport system permease protein
VLIQRASGVINFAQGAMAMYGIYTYVELRDSGRFVHPLPGIPAPDVGSGVTFWPAFFIALASAALIGLAVYGLVMRPLRQAPPLARLVALIGTLLTIDGLALVRFGWPGREARLVDNILPTERLTLLGATFPRDRLYMIALLAFVSIMLTVVYRYTKFGLATRAASESERGAVLSGLRPDRIAAINWMVASSLVTAFGILLAPTSSLDPTFLTFAIVPALAAALAARFSSFGVAAAVGVAIGVAQSLVLKLQVDVSWLPRQGLQEGIPLVLLIILVPIFGKKMMAREPLQATRLPLPPPPTRVGAAALTGAVIALIGLAALPSDFRLALILSMIGAIVCLSLVVLTGYLGQLSLAQMALAGIAGFTLSRVADDLGLPFPLSPLIAIAAATVLGFIVGIPSLRVRGTALAAVTLAMAATIEQLVFTNETFTNGFQGSRIPAPKLFGSDFGILTHRTADYPSWRFGVFVLALLVLVAVVVANLRRSRTGRILVAVRANERSAAALGIDITRCKLMTFTFSAAIAGLGGVLIGYAQTELSVASFTVEVSLMYLAWAYIGGIASVGGALIGGALVTGGLAYTGLDELVTLGRYETLVAGLALVVNAVLNPNGMIGLLYDLRDKLQRRLSRPGARPGISSGIRSVVLPVKRGRLP